jgi:hypothetical protein
VRIEDLTGARIVPEQAIFARLTTDGTPSGPSSITGDYSGSPEEFFLTVPDGQEWYFALAEFYIQGAGQITANGYGPTVALTNGVSLEVRSPAGDPLILVAEPVKTTGDYRSLPGTNIDTEERGSGDNYMVVDWDFVRARGGAMLLLPSGFSIVAVVNDDFTTLTKQFITLSGWRIDAA